MKDLQLHNGDVQKPEKTRKKEHHDHIIYQIYPKSQGTELTELEKPPLGTFSK